MSRPGVSNKPCHGCGRKVPHFTDSVCDDCRELMAFGQRMKDEQAAATLLEKEMFAVAERDYALPYLRHEVNTEDGAHSIRAPLHKLSFMLSEESSQGAFWRSAPSLWPYQKHSRGEWQIGRVMRKDVAEQLRLLFEGISNSLNAGYLEGFRAGKNLLLSLNAGTTSIADFNEAAIRTEKQYGGGE